MKKFLFFIFFVTICSICNSQPTFEKGTITKNNDMNIDGFVKINSDKEISFKTSMDSDAITYSSGTINGFSLSEPFRKFISMSLKNDKQPYFFEYFVEGNTSLLFLNDNYYLYSVQNDLNLLEIKKTTLTNRKGVYESSIDTYKGVLSNYAKNCPDVQSKAISTKFTHSKLSDFVVKLNQCQNFESHNFSDTSITNLIEIGVTAGGNFANFEHTGSEPYKTSGGEFGIHLGSFVAFSPNINRFHLTFELGIEYNQKNNTYSFKKQNLLYERTITTEAAVVEPFAAIIYQPFYNRTRLFSPYLGLGSSYGFKLKHDVRVTDQITDEFYKLDNNQSFSFIFKVGTFIQLKKHKFLFELSFSDYNYQDVGFVEEFGTNLQLKVGYVFNIK